MDMELAVKKTDDIDPLKRYLAQRDPDVVVTEDMLIYCVVNRLHRCLDYLICKDLAAFDNHRLRILLVTLMLSPDGLKPSSYATRLVILQRGKIHELSVTPSMHTLVIGHLGYSYDVFHQYASTLIAYGAKASELAGDPEFADLHTLWLNRPIARAKRRAAALTLFGILRYRQRLFRDLCMYLVRDCGHFNEKCVADEWY